MLCFAPALDGLQASISSALECCDALMQDASSRYGLFISHNLIRAQWPRLTHLPSAGGWSRKVYGAVPSFDVVMVYYIIYPVDLVYLLPFQKCCKFIYIEGLDL